jgi:hypothetical protein
MMTLRLEQDMLGRHAAGAGIEEALMALISLVAVVLMPLGLAGLLAITAWLERWLPPPDKLKAGQQAGVALWLGSPSGENRVQHEDPQLVWSLDSSTPARGSSRISDRRSA